MLVTVALNSCCAEVCKGRARGHPAELRTAGKEGRMPPTDPLQEARLLRQGGTSEGLEGVHGAACEVATTKQPVTESPASEQSPVSQSLCPPQRPPAGAARRLFSRPTLQLPAPLAMHAACPAALRDHGISLLQPSAGLQKPGPHGSGPTVLDAAQTQQAWSPAPSHNTQCYMRSSNQQGRGNMLAASQSRTLIVVKQTYPQAPA